MPTETTAKHTPGPWGIPCPGQTDAVKRAITYEGGEYTQIIADVFGPGRGATRETMEANARLIASAPSLLAACKLFRDQLTKFGQEHPQHGGWAGLLCTADKAIASAEGR